jgi:hypothetical protein
MLDSLLEIQKQSALEEAEDPEPKPKERTMTVSQLNEVLGLSEARIKVFEDTGSKLQRPAKTSQGDEEILEERRSLSRQPLLLDIFKSPSWTRASPLVPRR